MCCRKTYRRVAEEISVRPIVDAGFVLEVIKELPDAPEGPIPAPRAPRTPRLLTFSEEFNHFSQVGTRAKQPPGRREPSLTPLAETVLDYPALPEWAGGGLGCWGLGG